MNVSLNATDQPAFSPQNLTVIGGDTVTFAVHNAGSYNHSFTLATLGNYTFPRSDTPQQLTKFFRTNGSLLNLTLAPGATVAGNVTFPVTDAGVTLEFVSLVPYQFQAGMFGFVHVTYGTSTGTYKLTENTSASAFVFTPDTLVISSATTFPITVSVQVENLGSTYHTFTIEGQNNNTLNPGNFSTYFATHPPLANVNVPTTPGVPAWANFTITGKGAYEYICEASGHFAGGMFGWLYVGWSPAAPPAPPSSALVDVAFLIGGGALLLLALVLTVIASLVGRFPRGPAPPPHH